MNRGLTARGEWPGRVAFKAGWSQASARPVNDTLTDASLRLERGSAAFISRCCGWLFEHDAPSVQSIPLHPGMRGVWEDAGFKPFRQLLLMERDLSFAVEEPTVRVSEGSELEWRDALTLDDLAFDADWQIGRMGLADARQATPTSNFLTVHDGARMLGFSIIGIAQSTAYLQRIAVHPEAQGQGFGRSLLRASLLWAKNQRAITMLLNTQLDNDGAARLYKTERFEALPQHLVLLRASPS